MVSGNKRFLGYGLQLAHWAWEAVRNLEMKVVQFRPSPFVLAPNCAALPTKGLRGHARDFGELWDSGKLVCVYDVMTRLAKKPPSNRLLCNYYLLRYSFTIPVSMMQVPIH
jgi:hypothetical protein